MSISKELKKRADETMQELDKKLQESAAEYNAVEEKCLRFSEVKHVFEVVKKKGGKSAIPEVLVDEIDLSQNDRKVDIESPSFIALKESIKEQGLLQRPILTLGISSSKPFLCVAGHRRIFALKELGIATCPAELIYSENASDISYARLAENLVRQNLGPLELADAVFRLKERLKETTSGVARVLNKNRTYVTELLKIASWPKEARDLITKYSINMKKLSSVAKRTLSDEQILKELKKMNPNVSDGPTLKPSALSFSSKNMEKMQSFFEEKQVAEDTQGIIHEFLMEMKIRGWTPNKNVNH